MMDTEKEIVLNPLVGIRIDGININFGTKLEEVENLLGESVDTIYENIDVSFNFDDNDILEYIECGSNCLMICKVSIYENNLFEIPIRDLYDILSKHCENIHEKITGITSYYFEDIGVRFGIEYIGENPDWSEEEIECKDEYEFYAVTSIGIGTKNIIEN
jgi:hypothetical protein